MSKQYNIFLTVLFSLFLAGILGAHLLAQDRTFSQTENRYLQSLPTLTAENLSSGAYMEQFESYTTDQFPLRDLWVSAKAWSERLLGKRENNSVYFGSGDTLISRVDTPTADFLARAAGYCNALGEQSAVPVSLALIPSAAEIWRDRLPKGAPTAPEGEIISDFYGALTLPAIDLNTPLSAHREEALYYRTDHHWTSLGAYYGYQAIAREMGLEPVPLSQYEKTTVSHSFYGTLYSSSGVRWIPPDQIDAYVPAEGLSVTSYFTGLPEPGRLYAPEYLEQKDQYSYFLGGVQPLCVIETGHTGAPSILVIRDSYSDSLAPFLTEHFSQIHLLDLRYYNLGVAQYIQQAEIDRVLVLYSLKNFATDRNLFKLGL